MGSSFSLSNTFIVIYEMCKGILDIFNENRKLLALALKIV